MDGYHEDHYVVIETQTLSRLGRTVTLERRRPTAPEALLEMAQRTDIPPARKAQMEEMVNNYTKQTDYLVLLDNDRPTYLRYDGEPPMLPAIPADESLARLQQDWAALTANPTVSFEDLSWALLVQNDLGHTCNGAVIMY